MIFFNKSAFFHHRFRQVSMEREPPINRFTQPELGPSRRQRRHGTRGASHAPRRTDGFIVQVATDRAAQVAALDAVLERRLLVSGRFLAEIQGWIFGVRYVWFADFLGTSAKYKSYELGIPDQCWQHFFFLLGNMGNVPLCQLFWLSDCKYIHGCVQNETNIKSGRTMVNIQIYQVSLCCMKEKTTLWTPCFIIFFHPNISKLQGTFTLNVHCQSPGPM